MFNHIYGSPFPPINPRVRYKTALERAGFDVNYNEKPANVERPPNQLRTMERRNASTGSLNEMAEPPKRSQARVNSLPDNGVPRASSKLGFPRPGPQSTQRPRPPPGAPMPSNGMPPPNATTPRSMSPPNTMPLNAMTSNARQPNAISPNSKTPTARRPDAISPGAVSPTGMAPSAMHPNAKTTTARRPDAISPDVLSPTGMVPSARPHTAQAATTVSRPPPPEVDPIEKSFMLLTQNDTMSSIDVSGNTSKSSSQMFQRDTDSSHVSEQSRSLTQELSPPVEREQMLEQVFRSEGESVRSNHESVQSDDESASSDDESVNFEPEPELQVSLGERPISDIEPLNVRKQPLPPFTRPSSSVSQNPELTAANEQVEKLIAQLDDVSLSKNAQLNSKPPVLPPLQTTKPKNSSAYLSTFPQGPLIEQTVTPDDTLSDVGSTINGDTPLFYKFQKTISREFPQDEPMSIEPSHLMLKPSELPSRSPDPMLDPTPNLDFKYPPGTGPCRACGEEPTGKRIYSKKDNELSGQWHRDCFRCLTCNVRFTKSVPCYILDDRPYCRQHYHEENSSICQTCREFIEGECVENDRIERFHIDCLVCFLCREPITADYFIFNGELPLCGNHDMESLPSELLENDSPMSKRRTRLINFSA